MKGKDNMYNCAMCGIKACKTDLKGAPSGCPSLKDMEEVKENYGSLENATIANVAGILSSQHDKTRIEETIEFAKQCGYKKIGLAFCSALAKESEIIDKAFRHHGLETETLMCKVGALPKEMVGIQNSKTPMCNPIAQAKFLNEAKTDFNVVIGLCVGHDTLFIKYSNAPVTVLAVKDRVLAHTPLGAVYLADTFYKNKLFPKKD